MRELRCFDNQLTSLDLSGCTVLSSLYCFNNPITTLDVSMCHDLERLQCCDYFTGIDYESACPLESLKIYKYHHIDEEDMRILEKVYGDIIEYVE